MKKSGLVDMKIERNKGTDAMPGPIEAQGPQYPYGLCLRLGDEELKKLGLEKLPELGASIPVVAVARVTSASDRRSVYGADRSLELQITALKMGDEEKADS